MKISVIIPVYNVEKYLERCVYSVINQTYKNTEIILVDDGSLDRSGEICDKFAKKDKRIIVVHKRNGGLSSARNAGMDIMSGTYFFFIDSDDYIENKTLELLYDRALKTDADVVVSNVRMLQKEDKMLPLNRVYRVATAFSFNKSSYSIEDRFNTKDRYEYFYCPGYGNSAWNKLYKAQFIQNINLTFDESLHISEDYVFNIKCFVNNPKIEFVNEYTYNYCNYASTITKSQIVDLTEQTIYIMEEIYEYFKRKGILDINKDLVAYGVFGSVSQTSRNIYFHSKSKFWNIKNQLKKFKRSEIFDQSLKELARGWYLRGIPRRNWIIYVRLFSFLFGLNFFSLATVLLLIPPRINQ